MENERENKSLKHSSVIWSFVSTCELVQYRTKKGEREREGKEKLKILPSLFRYLSVLKEMMGEKF